MKISFFSNFLSSHQQPFSESMYQRLGNRYTFVSTAPIHNDRKAMGWKETQGIPYELKAYLSDGQREKALELARDSDVIVFGSAPEIYLQQHLKKGGMAFRYSERLYKEGLPLWRLPRAAASACLHHGRYQKYPVFMLCASAYTAADLLKFGNYRNRTYRWGYFPKISDCPLDSLMLQKQNAATEILWIGRLIPLKHPESAIHLASRLKAAGCAFHLTIIGSGPLENALLQSIASCQLHNEVLLTGNLPEAEVFRYLMKGNVVVSTSDFLEGWGAVINEAMSCGCAVVASHAIGSVPYLISHTRNGLIYQYGNEEDLYDKVKLLLDTSSLQYELGKNAYLTIKHLWNADIAADRLIQLAERLRKGDEVRFEDGPCSAAPTLKNNWFTV